MTSLISYEQNGRLWRHCYPMNRTVGYDVILILWTELSAMTSLLSYEQNGRLWRHCYPITVYAMMSLFSYNGVGYDVIVIQWTVVGYGGRAGCCWCHLCIIWWRRLNAVFTPHVAPRGGCHSVAPAVVEGSTDRAVAVEAIMAAYPWERRAKIEVGTVSFQTLPACNLINWPSLIDCIYVENGDDSIFSNGVSEVPCF